MKSRFVLLTLALGLSTGIGAGAASTEPLPFPAPAAPVAPAPPYRVAVEDQLHIEVVEFPNLTSDVTVPPDGQVSVPLLGSVPVAGKTTTQIAQMLTRKWRAYVINPAVSVSLTKKHTENVVFYGFVFRPGQVEYRPPLHILEALGNAGGALMNADLARTAVTHRDGRKQVVDLSHPENKGGTESDILLETGDVVYVPERHQQVSVVGQVTNAGSYEYKDNMTVLEAITLAGGVKDGAALRSATFTHDGKTTPIDLEALFKRGDLSVNAKMSPGDAVSIPEAARNYVYGDVQRPGYYNFRTSDHMLDALQAAGGPMPDSNLTKVNLIHYNKVGNTATLQEVDLDSFLRRGKTTGNPLLQPGDVIYVPTRKKALSWSDLYSALAGINVFSAGTRLLSGH